MHAHRFHLPTLELKKLARLETRELDAIARRRRTRLERQAADQAEAREALRAALRPSGGSRCSLAGHREIGAHLFPSSL